MWCVLWAVLNTIYGARNHGFIRLSLMVFLLAQIVLAGKTDDKYFHEPGEDDRHHHYDSRFFERVVSDGERQITLRALVRAYLLLFENFQLDTWIAHGTLLGWYWNGRILPWVSSAVLATTTSFGADHAVSRIQIWTHKSRMRLWLCWRKATIIPLTNTTVRS